MEIAADMLLPFLRKPPPTDLHRYFHDQRRRSFSYVEIGRTALEPPPGYVVDHTRVCLGIGQDVFDAAQGVLEHWQQFRLGWLEPVEPPAAIREGEIVTLLARLLGVWWLNACRIVYVVDEQKPLPRFGFAYGTLTGHMETGEERFLIEMDDEQRVWYDILAFSRPQRLAARLGYPYVRRVQKRFGRDSAARVRQAVDTLAGASCS